MRWLFSAVYSEIRGLHQSAYILGAFSFGSQILALVRDRLFAHYFGASSDLDVYYAAFKVPDLLFVLFASVLSVYVLIPFVSEKTENGNVRGAQHMPAAQMVLVSMADAALNPLWVWLVFGEVPSEGVFAGGALVLLAIAVNAWPQLRTAGR